MLELVARKERREEPADLLSDLLEELLIKILSADGSPRLCRLKNVVRAELVHKLGAPHNMTSLVFFRRRFLPLR